MDLKNLSNNDLCKEYEKILDVVGNSKSSLKDILRFSEITKEICERFLANWYEDR